MRKFSELASKYHRLRSRSYHLLRLKNLRPLISREDLVLDVGCGAGSFLLDIDSMWGIGLDVSRKMLRTSKQLLRNVKDRTDLVVGDAEVLPFRSSVFNAVIMMDVIEHIPSAATAIKESARVMTDKGKIVINTPKHFLYPALKLIELFRYKLSVPTKLIPIRELLSMLRAHYRIVAVRSVMFISRFVVAEKVAHIEILKNDSRRDR